MLNTLFAGTSQYGFAGTVAVVWHQGNRGETPLRMSVSLLTYIDEKHWYQFVLVALSQYRLLSSKFAECSATSLGDVELIECRVR